MVGGGSCFLYLGCGGLDGAGEGLQLLRDADGSDVVTRLFLI